MLGNTLYRIWNAYFSSFLDHSLILALTSISLPPLLGRGRVTPNRTCFFRFILGNGMEFAVPTATSISKWRSCPFYISIYSRDEKVLSSFFLFLCVYFLLCNTIFRYVLAKILLKLDNLFLLNISPVVPEFLRCLMHCTIHPNFNWF